MILRYSPTIFKKLRQPRAFVFRFRFDRLFRIALVFLLPVLFVFSASTQDMENAGDSNEPAVEETFDKPAPVLYEPDNRMDPFLRIVPKVSTAKVGDEEIPRGNPPPGIAGIVIDKAGLEGIVIRGGNLRLAIIRGADKRAYFLSEGARIFDGYLQTIQNDSVVFVRETIMRSGKTLTQEVTKRLRKS